MGVGGRGEGGREGERERRRKEGGNMMKDFK